MAEFGQDQTHKNNYGNHQLRTNIIKTKKCSGPHDKEQLYAQNLQLRNRIKDLIELNTKMKTQLSITEKQKLNLCQIAQDEVFHPKIAPRSHSGSQKRSGNSTQITHSQQPIFGSALQKQKQNVTFKKLIREQTIQIEKLHNQNQRLKKTMKFTRMNELITQNNQFVDQTLRLKAIIAQKKDSELRMQTEFLNQIEFLRKKLAQEKDSDKKNGYQLKKQVDLNGDLREKLGEMESKKIESEKRLNRQNKTLRHQISQIKSRLYEQTVVKGRDCDRQDCIRNQKQKFQMKKKKQIQDKQVKRLRDDLESLRRQLQQKDYQIKRIKTQDHSKPLTSQKNRSNASAVIKKDQSLSNAAESRVKNEPVSPQKAQDKSKSMEGSHVSEVQAPLKQVEERQQIKVHPKMKDNLLQKQEKQEQVPNKKKEQSDSDDTDKLLASVDDSKQLDIESAKKPHPSVSNKQQQKNNQPESTAKELLESDGEYEQLNYDDFQDDLSDIKNQKQKQKKEKKKGQAKEEKKAKGEEKSKGQSKEEKSKGEDKEEKKKKKDKSTKKIEPQSRNNQQEQGEKQKQQDGDKAQLKLLKQTLVYKFMAQNYSYDNFSSDIKGSNMKQFTIAQVINLMTAQPFLLQDNQVETIMMYIFDTDHPTGEEVINSKEFVKKMKKFIGKTKNIDEEREREHIEIIGEIIENNNEKLIKKFKEFDGGDRIITLQQFTRVMNAFKIKDNVLQTAIAHIALVSQDINTLNYEFFLRRFSDDQ